MCFSPTASFTVGAILTIGGTYATVRAIKSSPEFVPISAYPIGFGIQQIIEGGVWVSLLNNSIEAAQLFAFGFLFFSHFFWPFWTPFSVFWLERRSIYKGILLALTIIGGLFGASIYFPLFLNDWLQVGIENSHIAYDTTLLYDQLISRTLTRLFYAAVVLVPLFLALKKFLKVFSALILISMLATFFLYESIVFISVWCFFAAIISIYVIYILHRQSII